MSESIGKQARTEVLEQSSVVRSHEFTVPRDPGSVEEDQFRIHPQNEAKFHIECEDFTDKTSCKVYVVPAAFFKNTSWISTVEPKPLLREHP
ncbi:hypothetical protein N7517_004575 [Penicillium concentricum]|uniref:Uncharacterized protein n=1 Tax=Penicillium concentricum TaxID=293559 RepID=A0A9W9S7T9_9EURO|nr:uncharacterized protein N7517_004575 [Penicillium concentricum]KAJ5372569.1 hypothetical protein N7517_004575 [Penicillium concentricum]